MALILAVGYSRPIMGVTSTYSRWSIDPEFFNGSRRSLPFWPLAPFGASSIEEGIADDSQSQFKQCTLQEMDSERMSVIFKYALFQS